MDGIAIIDVSEFVSGDTATRTEIAAKIARAVEEIGFLTVTGHGVPAGIINQVRKGAASFFGLPLESKEMYLHPSRNLNRGYTPFEGEYNGASTGRSAPADLREGYIFGSFERPRNSRPDSAAAGHAYQDNIWPDTVPGLTDIFRAYYSAVAEFNVVLLEIFATALDLDRGFFRQKFHDHASVVRILHYPAQIETPPEGQLRCGAHTDYGSHTILLADDSPGGLQVLTRSGEWIDAVPPKNAFIINIGDMMEMWTNDRWRSNQHRVANPPAGDAPTGDAPAGDRLSIAFFTYPNPDVLIECIPTCLSDTEAPKHPPVLAGDYRRTKVQSITVAAQAR